MKRKKDISGRLRRVCTTIQENTKARREGIKSNNENENTENEYNTDLFVEA